MRTAEALAVALMTITTNVDGGINSNRTQFSEIRDGSRTQTEWCTYRSMLLLNVVIIIVITIIHGCSTLFGQRSTGRRFTQIFPALFSAFCLFRRHSIFICFTVKPLTRSPSPPISFFSFFLSTDFFLLQCRSLSWLSYTFLLVVFRHTVVKSYIRLGDCCIACFRT